MAEPVDPEIRRLFEERKAFDNAMLGMLHAWSHLENNLALLLGSIVRDGAGSLASAIYFAPNSFEVRKQVVEAAMFIVCEPFDQDGSIRRLWGNWSSKIDKNKKVRNQVAHGQIITHAVNGKNRIRLCPPLFNFGHYAVAHKKRQLPGYSAHDIEQSARSLSHNTEATWIFRDMINACIFQKPQALPEISQKLELHLKQI